ncbi:amino acid/polyamine/organocation transporter, APC superfamily [Granulicatella balaenopterae]|uniref:Amino acid/polyamine/organocation transporter, APC superfamily n=1 Tax=Granulicatella balaenopterae TaxID=137733 RepID=A0A1H9KER2_9LACT|nr:APC family permease [Granulicatella balaenopterae]SEQ97353.1 amino acid/polyamine/organocation transporter, APC superfamily [Granulicatella balaenopterae]
MKKNELGKFDVLGLVIGSIIGLGSFTLPGKQFLQQSGVVNTTIGLVVGGLLIMFIQYSYHTMLSVHEKDGGEFTYALDNLGRAHGFIVAWSLSLCYLSMIPLNASAYVLLYKLLLGDQYSFFLLYSFAGYQVYLSDIIIMSSVILLFAWINIKGLRISSKIQNTLITLLVVIVFTMAALMVHKSGLSTLEGYYVTGYQFSFSEIATVIAIVPFLFVGFDVIPQVATDLNFKPSKTAKLSIVSLMIGVLIYATLNFIAGLSYGPKEAMELEWAVASSIISQLGYIGFGFMLVALLAAITGGINGFMIASSKLIAALGDRDMMSKRYAYKNKNNANPYAIMFVTAISLLATLVGREVIIYIVDMASVLAAIAYLYVSYVSIRFAKNTVGKILSIISVGVSLSFILLLLVPISPAFLSCPSIIFLIVWAMLGLFVYSKQIK